MPLSALQNCMHRGWLARMRQPLVPALVRLSAQTGHSQIIVDSRQSTHVGRCGDQRFLFLQMIFQSRQSGTDTPVNHHIAKSYFQSTHLLRINR